MEKSVPNLNSPLVLKNALIKNRLFFPNALPKTQQGPETFPADPIISFYSSIAKNGAGIICYADMSNSGQRTAFNNDEQHFPMYDIGDPSVENYISQLADNVHYYGSKIIVDVSAGNCMNDVDVVDGLPDELPPKDLDHEVHIAEMKPERRAMTRDDMDKYIGIAVEKARYYQRLGFDGGYLGLFQGKYGNFLSSELNTRNDEFGGDLEGRARFPMMLLKSIRQAVGNDFMLVLDINRFSKGLQWCDALEVVKMAQPYIDLIHLRAVQVQTAFEGTEEEYFHPQNIQMAREIKQAGISTPIAAWTGFQEFALMENALASGDVDMLASGRFQLCNPSLGKALKEYDDSELLPCLLCNKCHGDTLKGPWVAKCSVNPTIGLAARVERMVLPVERGKNVAVVGGGPAGMAAAMYLRQRGHQVELFERESRLGGQILTSEYPDFKWPLKRFLHKLTDITMKNGTVVHLETEASEQTIKDRQFDAVVLALGSEARKPAVPGAESPEIWSPIQVYGHEAELGTKVVCVGGSETSVETALYLARCGHSVTLVTRKKRIASDANPIHYVDELRSACYGEPNMVIMEQTETVRVSVHEVVIVKDGQEHALSCDSVVAAGGVKPRWLEATAFSGAAPEVYYIGDCMKAENIAHCMRTAFAAANQI